MTLETLHYREVQYLPSNDDVEAAAISVLARHSDSVQTIKESFSKATHYALVG